MIKYCGRPGHGAVAVVTSVAAGNMIRVFAGSDYAVMARITTAENLQVIHLRNRLPEIDAVAVFTHICGHNVFRATTRCFNAVVAADTTGGYVVVIELDVGPSQIRVTSAAPVTSLL